LSVSQAADPPPDQVAVLGGGVMGETVLAGMLRAGRDPESVRVGEKRAERADELARGYGVRVVDNPEAVRGADVVLLVVKPPDVPGVLADVAGELAERQLLVSLAAGVSTRSIEGQVPDGVVVVRVMPNTPATVDQGVYVASPGSRAGEAHLDVAEALLGGSGRVVRLPESQQDAATALSGSGPAYLFLVVEAMVEAGVHLGLPRPTATELAVQTAYGATRMLSETGEHPGVLRERVTSPGGTTAAALGQLERHGVRAAFLDALAAARDRSRELSGE